MSSEVVFTSEADSISSEHLLQHYRRDRRQEDLCFALWRPSYRAVSPRRVNRRNHPAKKGRFGFYA